MSNAKTLPAIEAKLATFTSKCRDALEARGLAITGKPGKDRKHLADVDPALFIKLRDESGIKMVGGQAT